MSSSQVNSEHISRTVSLSGTQLGINHLYIRDQYKSWILIFKNLGREYKKMKKRKDYFELIKLLCEEIFLKYYHEIFPKRENNSKLPDDTILKNDVNGLIESIKAQCAEKLGFQINNSKSERVLKRLVEESVKFVNYVVLVRPIANFIFTEKKVVYNESYHEIKNQSERENVSDLDPEKLIITDCIYPSYGSGDKIFLKAGVIVKRETIEDILYSEVQKLMVEIGNIFEKVENEHFSVVKDCVEKMFEKKLKSVAKKNVTKIVKSSKKLSEGLSNEEVKNEVGEMANKNGIKRNVSSLMNDIKECEKNLPSLMENLKEITNLENEGKQIIKDKIKSMKEGKKVSCK